MTTEEERRDLALHPLPSDANNYSVCSPDMVLANIAYLTEQIESEQIHLAYLRIELERLKGRAISENIKESDGFYLIEIPGKKMRNRIDTHERINDFSVMFPETIMKIRDQQYVAIADDAERKRLAVAVSPIPLELADAKLGKEVVTEFTGYQPQKITIEVREKQKRLK